jgi:hypothetical protein
MLWQLLLPWSPVLASDAAAGELIPVCTSVGLKWIAPDDGAPGESHADPDRTHCALCCFEPSAPVLHDTRDPLAHVPVVVCATFTPSAGSPADTRPGIPPPIRAPPFRS